MPLRTRKKQLTFHIPLLTFSPPNTEGWDPKKGHRRSDTIESVQTDTSKNTCNSSGSPDGVRLEAQKPKRRKPWHKRLNPLKKSRKPPYPAERTVSLEYGASFWSLFTFRWMSPLMAVGYQRPLEIADIWLVNPNRSAEVLTAKVQDSYNKRFKRGDRHPLLWAMHETFKIEFWLGGFCQLFANILAVVSPYTLRYLIRFAAESYVASIEHTRGPSIGKGVGLVLGITAMQMLQSMGTSHSLYFGMMVGGQARAVLIAMIFDKSMKVSGRAKAGGKAITEAGETRSHLDQVVDIGIEKMDQRRKKEKKKPVPKDTPGITGDGSGWGNGRVVNLMSVDTYRISQACGMFHMIWTAPVSINLTLILLLVNLGYSALSGFALLLVGLPFLGKAVKFLFTRRKAISKITDQRVSLTQEILQAMRFVKFFGWERSFMNQIDEIRGREVRSIQILLAIRNIIATVSISLPIFAMMLSFVTFSLTRHKLDPAAVFSSVALFNALRMPLSMLPVIIGQVVDARAALERIQEYLLAEEMEKDGEVNTKTVEAVQVKNADFTWERTPTADPAQAKAKSVAESKSQAKAATKTTKQSAKEKASGLATSTKNLEQDDSLETSEARRPFQLHGMNFNAQRNELIAVIGGVGSGKSSLLAALAGDMRRTNGQVIWGASRAFCPQNPWIQNATVKDNILFGKKMYEGWYKKVVQACALTTDLQMLPDGDATEIGERGITVSGGQKQRLNIARAIYFDAEIVLLDDPLSAVDVHVGRHIFENAICGLLKNKCRILATHQLNILHRCDRVIWMENGRIRAFDTYDKLIKRNQDFAKMMLTTALERKTEVAEGAKDEDAVEETKPEEAKKDLAAKKKTQLMQTEERATKSVPWSLYMAYIRSSGTVLTAPLIVLLLVFAQGTNIATSLWLSYWISNKFGYRNGVYIGIYAALGVSQALLMYFFAITLALLSTRSSKSMLNQAMKSVLRAPMSFFDTTPMGRITTRFSKDIDQMDFELTDAIRLYFLTLAMIISIFTLIIVYFHYFAIALGPLFLLFLFYTSYYRASAREIKRHESVLQSVVFARFSEALSGIASIRAYGLQDIFVHRLKDTIDNMNSAYYLTFANQRWLSVRLDLVGNILIFTAGILVVTSRFDVSPSIAGLVLSYILSIVQMIQYIVRQFAEVENAMNATERLHYYGTKLESEAPLHLAQIPPSWPATGEITFSNVHMRYRADLPPVLKGISMYIRGGEHIGIVGRTGAGKSSIITTLFRLNEISSGSIIIDDQDIARVGLQDLRSRLTIIPQDPNLFKGTIRSNLDPFSQYTDLELWSALRQSTLIPEDDIAITSRKSGYIHLDDVVEEEGANFSLGQRQLMALARALVRNSQIIVCDEATSSLNMETDVQIQRTMQTAFQGKTLLCIAHRLRTIINYDRICVMDQGHVVELDTPRNLFEQGGIFREMCDQGGIREGDFPRKTLWDYVVDGFKDDKMRRDWS